MKMTNEGRGQKCKLCGEQAYFENNITCLGKGEHILCQDNDGNLVPHIKDCIIIGPGSPDRKKIEKLLGIK